MCNSLNFIYVLYVNVFLMNFVFVLQFTKMVTCAVASCSNNTNRNKKSGVTFHSFPMNNPSVLALWMKFLASIKDLDGWCPTMWSKVCSEHFTKDCFTETKSVHRLKNDAVPTIALRTGAFGADNAAKALMELNKQFVIQQSGVSAMPVKAISVEAISPAAGSSQTMDFTNSTEDMEVDSTLDERSRSLLADAELTVRRLENAQSGESTEKCAQVSDGSNVESVSQKRAANDHESYFTPKLRYLAKPTYRKYVPPWMSSHSYDIHNMLHFVIRLLIHNIDFKMACNCELGGKFDDIYLQIQEGDQLVHMFFQFKYSSRPIVLSDFIGHKRGKAGKFSIKDYLKSHVNLEMYVPGNVMCILFTNTNILYGNSMKDLTLDGSILSEVFVKTDIFADKKLMQFKGQKFNEVIENFTGGSSENVNKFCKEFFLATEQPGIEELESLIKHGLSCVVKDIKEGQTYSLFCCLKEFFFKWQSEAEVTFITNSSVQEKINELMTLSIGALQNTVEILPKVFGVKRPVDHFCGRDEELSMLQRLLQKEKSDKVIDIVIIGMHGVGKTQLVHKYVANELNNYKHIIWINAENKKTIMQSMLNIYNQTVNNDVSLLIQNVDYPQKIYQMLNTKKCLIIFDNAKSPQIINEFLPNIANYTSEMYFIVTSIYTEWTCRENINLELFSKEDCTVLMRSILQKNYEEKYVDMIEEKCGYLPLCIQVACAYINDNIKANTLATGSVCDVISLNELDIKVLYPYICNNIFQDTLAHGLKNRTLAEELLQMCAFVAPTNIPVPFFASDNDECNAIMLLQQHSFIQVENTNMSVLPALQFKLLSQISQEKTEIYLRKLLRILEKKLQHNSVCIEAYLTHAIKLWEHIKCNTNILKDHPEFPVIILTNVQLDVISTAKYDNFVRNICAYSKEVFGENNVYIYEVCSKKIEMLYLLGNYELALHLCNELLINSVTDSKVEYQENEAEILVKTLFQSGNMPLNHTVILSTLEVKAKILHKLEQYNKAHEIYKFVYEIYKETLKKHEKTIQSVLDLYQNCINMKRYNSPAEMLVILQYVTDALSYMLDKQHPACITVMCEQAACYEDLGELNKCLCLLTNAAWLKSKDHATKPCTVELPIEVSLNTTSLQSKLYLADKIVEKKIQLFGENDTSVYKSMIIKTKILCQLGQVEQVSSYLMNLNVR